MKRPLLRIIFGREPKVVTKTFNSPYQGEIVNEVELFTWEKLDYIEKVKETFELIEEVSY